jgi:hypothetical protein
MHHACRTFLDQWDDIAYQDDEAARAHAEEGLERVKRLGDPPVLLARVLALLGSSFRRTNPRKALVILLRSLLIYSTIDEKLDQCDALRRLGIVLGELPRLRRFAMIVLDTAKKFAESNQARELAAKVRAEIGALRGARGDYVGAFEDFTEALRQLSGIYLDGAFFNALAAFFFAKRHGQKIPPALRDRGLLSLRASRLAPSTRERYGDEPRPGQKHYSYGTSKPTEADAAARWLIGLLLADQQQLVKSEGQLESAYADYVKWGFGTKVAEISLDLGEVYLKLRRWGKLRLVARDACILLQDSPRLHEAFKLYAIAVKGQEMEDVWIQAQACRKALEEAA